MDADQAPQKGNLGERLAHLLTFYASKDNLPNSQRHHPMVSKHTAPPNLQISVVCAAFVLFLMLISLSLVSLYLSITDTWGTEHVLCPLGARLRNWFDWQREGPTVPHLSTEDYHTQAAETCKSSFLFSITRSTSYKAIFFFASHILNNSLLDAAIEELKRGIALACHSRARSRFAVPVLLSFDGLKICRSAGLAEDLELATKSWFTTLPTCKQIEEFLYLHIKCFYNLNRKGKDHHLNVDALLLGQLNVKYVWEQCPNMQNLRFAHHFCLSTKICDLMKDEKMHMYGIPTAASEKCSPHHKDRFTRCHVPYPGTRKLLVSFNTVVLGIKLMLRLWAIWGVV